jgi:hypothetical protein
VTRAAACSCGQLSVTLSGEPHEVTVCHCLQCQRSTGSVFGAYAFWPRSACRSIQGEAKHWRRVSDSGHWVDSSFCPICGSTVYWSTELAMDQIGISVGTFADPSCPAPTAAVWDSSRHPWIAMPAAWPRHARDAATVG